ncbi:hypothetical protein PoB_004353100 [Plakobranchus ocellatus]|uniref:Uncharacterized protein n=1 Tax=Plakobranchus ocellatus TaxID=259542 RepID=A0AAV4BDZ5_9GAST|nr:hypothetical protein PoB_004353100 [Plakobranchus ocellatus]
MDAVYAFEDFHSYKIALVTFMRNLQIEGDSVYHCVIRDKGSVQNEVGTSHCITNGSSRRSEASGNLPWSKSLRDEKCIV